MNEQRKKLAIIGASSFQEPLITKAKQRGIETHVFAWECGDVGEKLADQFYPISITEKETILEECKRIGIDGIASIGSDLANIAVAYVADAMGLTANSVTCVSRSTDKHLMRQCFAEYGDPSPKSILVDDALLEHAEDLELPVIVKPTDRSGSRGINYVEDAAELEDAIAHAREAGFSDAVLVEEYAQGQEYSVECISWNGKHTLLAITEKFTTGAPQYIETGHLEPARVDAKTAAQIKDVVFKALDHLEAAYGASHSELKVDEDGTIKIIEIGTRMGGDCIGSNLVELSTGYDFVNAVINVSLGEEPAAFDAESAARRAAAVRFIFTQADEDALQQLKATCPDLLYYESEIDGSGQEITDSSTRHGYFIFHADDPKAIEDFLPENAA